MTWATMKMDGSFAVHDGIPKLEELQAAVGGLVQVVELEHDVTMWCHEEAKYAWQGLGGTEPRSNLENQLMTWLALEAKTIATHDWIAGDVAFTGGPDDQGESQGLSDDQVAWLRVKILSRAVIAGDMSGMVRGHEVPA